MRILRCHITLQSKPDEYICITFNRSQEELYRLQLKQAYMNFQVKFSTLKYVHLKVGTNQFYPHVNVQGIKKDLSSVAAT